MDHHPVQTIDHQGGKINKVVTLAAYEVYVEIYGPHDALITGNCRGGFSTGELIALLYARAFPRREWRQRVADASAGMSHV